MPRSASPLWLWRKVDVRSAKSTLISPVVKISSAMQLIACRKTSSAALKASTRDICLFSGSFMRLSLCTTISASRLPCIFAIPSLAMRFLRAPSKEKGTVTTPTVNMPMSLASLATTGAAPVPAPPPMLAVTKTRSAPRIASLILSASPFAAASPISATPPVPRPFVNSRPMAIARMPTSSICAICFASVLTAINSTSSSFPSAMRAMTLLPPPPTPMIFIVTTAFLIFSLSIMEAVPPSLRLAAPSLAVNYPLAFIRHFLHHSCKQKKKLILPKDVSLLGRLQAVPEACRRASRRSPRSRRRSSTRRGKPRLRSHRTRIPGS